MVPHSVPWERDSLGSAIIGPPCTRRQDHDGCRTIKGPPRGALSISRSRLSGETEKFTLDKTVQYREMIGALDQDRRLQVPALRKFRGLPFEFIALTATNGGHDLDAGA